MLAWLRPSHPRFELVVAATLAALAVTELAIDGLLHTPAEGVLAASVAVPLAVRFERPLSAVVLTSGLGTLVSVRVHNEGQVLIPTVCMLVALYAVGARCTGWRFWAGGAAAAGFTALGMVLRGDVSSDLFLAVAFPAAGLLIGRASGVLRLETEVLEERTTVLERDRDEHTRLALQHERSRIARELHDVIGHSISVMGLQAGAVRSVLPPERAQEREALLAVERVGRDAVGEMRRLIGLLRTEDDGPEGPSPSLARLDELADEMRRAGQDLALTVEGEVGQLPPGVDLAAYRIVQEALTNALKHAPGARVEARIRREPGALELEVENDTAAVPSRNGHVGHGLLGMRERAGLYGGEVDAGPRRDGGFRVLARLPVGEA